MKKNISKIFKVFLVVTLIFTIYNLLVGYFYFYLYRIILLLIIVAIILNKKEQSKLGIIFLLLIYIFSIISYTTGFLSNSNELFKIIPKSKYGYSFERAYIDNMNEKYKIINNYNDFIEIYNKIDSTFSNHYNYEIEARTRTISDPSLFLFEKNYYYLSNKQEDRFFKNEFNKLHSIKDEINEEYFSTKNILVVNEILVGARVLNSEIVNVVENENTVNISINLNNPDFVAYASKEKNVHIIYISKNITNVNINEINK